MEIVISPKKEHERDLTGGPSKWGWPLERLYAASYGMPDLAAAGRSRRAAGRA